MRFPLLVLLPLLAAAPLAGASNVSDKDIPPPIELTGTDRRTDVIELGGGDRILQYNNPDRDDDKKGKKTGKPTPSRIRIFIPGNVPKIKGVWFDLGATYTPDSAALQAMCRAEGFAFVGCLLRYKYGTELYDLAIKDFAQRSGHPELERCPIVVMGFSRNGARAWDFAAETPGRSIALCLGGNPGICAGFRFPERIEMAKAIPALTLCGSSDPFVDYGKKDPTARWHVRHYPEIRRQAGVTWGMMLGWKLGHEWGDSWPVFITYVQDVFALRLAGPPAGDGATPLKAIAFEDGYLAEHGWTRPWPEIAPAKTFAGDRTNAIWLPGANTAHVWRAYQIEKSLAALTVGGTGASIALSLDQVPAGTTQVEYFDRATSLGTVSRAPFTLAKDGLATGVHTLFAVLSTADGPSPTRPVTVIAGKAVDWKTADADWKRAGSDEQVALLSPALRQTLIQALAAAGPRPADADLAALRARLEVLSKDAFVEQRNAASGLLKRLAAGGPAPAPAGEQPPAAD